MPLCFIGKETEISLKIVCHLLSSLELGWLVVIKDMILVRKELA